jgi:hypothetical protein
MSGTSAGWSKERRARQAEQMAALNKSFTPRKRGGTWTPERRQASSARLKLLNTDSAFRMKKRAGIAKAGPTRLVMVPEHCHPIVAGLFLEMRSQRASCRRVGEASGISDYTIRSWHRCMPRLDNIDAALGVLGFELAIVPIGRRGKNGFTTKKLPTGD